VSDEHTRPSRALLIEELFGDGVSEDEARAIIRLAMTARSVLDPLKLRAGVPMGNSSRRVLAEDLEACARFPRGWG
jgi:hypothetical protein